jgi:Restriction alleviation protein Lar
MRSEDLLPCPLCGSRAELDANSVSEGNWDWQNCWIECTKDKDKNCGVILDLHADFYYIRNSNEVLIEAWNKLDRSRTRKDL